MAKRWGNSVLAYNYRYITCDYCGNLVKDGVPFQINKYNGHIFVFHDKVCENIWDKKHGTGQRSSE